MKKTYYDLLEVSSTATPEEIKAAALYLLQKYDPSKYPGNAQAAARFKQTKIVYATLADAQKRAAYNAMLDASLSKAADAALAKALAKAATSTPATPEPLPSTDQQPTVTGPKRELKGGFIEEAEKKVSTKEGGESSFLMPGERVIYRARLHWFIYVTPLLLMLIPTYFVFANPARLEVYVNMVDFLQDKLAYITIGLQVLIAIGVLQFLYAIYRHWTTMLLVTSKRVIAKIGRGGHINEISHAKFEHLEIKPGLLGTVLGFGTLKIRGTRGRGVGGLKIEVSHLSAPKVVEKKLMQAIRSGSGGYEG